MNIGFVVDSLNVRSGARAPIKIAEGLAKIGETVTVYSYKFGLDPKVKVAIEHLGVKVVFIDSLSSRLGRFLTFFKAIKPLRKGDQDLISCHSSIPLFFGARLSGKPVIYTYYGTQLPSFDQKMNQEIGFSQSILKRTKFFLANRIILFLEILRVNLADRTLGISKSTVEEANRLYHRKIDPIYLGADLGDLGEKKAFKRIKGGLLLLSVSRIVPYKGFHRLIKAFNKLVKNFPTSYLVLVGTSPNLEYLNYLQKEKNSQTEIILNISDQLLKQYYQNCDIYLSGTSWEGFGLPFLEAQNYGKPVLGFKNTSLFEVVADGETGCLAGNQDDFEVKLKLMMEDKTLREQMGKKAKEFAKQFTWEKTAYEYRQYFKDFLKGTL